ncbi:MAG: hypothetical protein R3F37_14060 [Candidatus Competibacteraceae bacterium]
MDGTPPRTVDWRPFASDGATSDILWLVDVSNPARSATVARQQLVLKNWAANLSAWQRVGLAVFAEDLTVLAPLGSTSTTLTAALDQLVARGHSTAFYRSLLDGIALLARTVGERKSLWIFSDAMAEDTAYRYQDVLESGTIRGHHDRRQDVPNGTARTSGITAVTAVGRGNRQLFAAAPAPGYVRPLRLSPQSAAITEGGGSFP